MPQLIEPTVLEDHGLSVGFVFVQGAGFRIGTFDGRESRQMSAAAARRLAKTLSDTSEAEELQPVIDALNSKADALDALLRGDGGTDVIEGMRPEGSA